MGKTICGFAWSLLKVGYDRINSNGEKLRPKSPVLILAPGDLHQQTAAEGMDKFGLSLIPLDSQETFTKFTRQPGSALTSMTAEGKPILAPGFYISSYTQLTTNGSLDDCPCWDRKGEYIYFRSNRGGVWNIWRFKPLLETKAAAANN